MDNVWTQLRDACARFVEAEADRDVDATVLGSIAGEIATEIDRIRLHFEKERWRRPRG